MEFKKSKNKVDLSKCSKLRLYTGKLGTYIESEFQIDSDGETLQLISIYDGKVLGVIYLNKEDAVFIEEWVKNCKDVLPKMVEEPKKDETTKNN